MGADAPAFDPLVPAKRREQRVKKRSFIEAEFLGDEPTIALNLQSIRKFLGWNEAGLLEKGQIAICIIVALNARIAIPVPDSAKIARVVDHAKAVDAGFAQLIAGEYSRPAAAENGDIEVLADRAARRHRLVRVRCIGSV